ncbi:MAG: hypothetical protein QOE66_1755, partial [Chloroflexota bacterium]|nr:hypothetical protein [Chloroflexota bacterium]
GSSAAPSSPGGVPSIVGSVDASTWERLALAPRVVAPTDPVAGHALVLATIRAGAIVSAAVEGSLVVGLAIVGPMEADRRRELLAVGVAPSHRRRGLAAALLTTSTGNRPHDIEITAEVTLAERDPIEPLDRATRATVARRLLERAGFAMRPSDADVRAADPGATRAVLDSH